MAMCEGWMVTERPCRASGLIANACAQCAMEALERCARSTMLCMCVCCNIYHLVISSGALQLAHCLAPAAASLNCTAVA